MATNPPSRLKRAILTSLKVGAYLFVVGAIALAVAVSEAVSQLPSYGELVRRDDLGQMIRVRAADGRVIHAMGPSFGQWLRHDEIPPIMREAMIAVEDRRFRSHPGIDPIGIARALMVRLSEGRWRQGGSTITQQLARNIFLTNDRSFARKVREGILALALEWRFSTKGGIDERCGDSHDAHAPGAQGRGRTTDVDAARSSAAHSYPAGLCFTVHCRP